MTSAGLLIQHSTAHVGSDRVHEPAPSEMLLHNRNIMSSEVIKAGVCSRRKAPVVSCCDSAHQNHSASGKLCTTTRQTVQFNPPSAQTCMFSTCSVLCRDKQLLTFLCEHILLSAAETVDTDEPQQPQMFEQTLIFSRH